MATVISTTDDQSVTETDGRDATDVSPTTDMADATARNLTRLFKLLADETRLRILHHLFTHRELNVRSLCELLNQSQPAVSHHLALLRNDGLIDCRRDGKHNYYFLLPNRFGELMSTVFAVTPGEEHEIRLDRYRLTLQQPK